MTNSQVDDTCKGSKEWHDGRRYVPSSTVPIAHCPMKEYTNTTSANGSNPPIRATVIQMDKEENHNYNHNHETSLLTTSRLLEVPPPIPIPSYYAQIRHELWEDNGWFSLEEYDGRQIDIQATFAPPPLHKTLLLRLLLLTWTVATMLYDWQLYLHSSSSSRSSTLLCYLSHLTNNTMIVTILYQSTALFNMFLALCHRYCFRYRSKRLSAFSYSPVVPPTRLLYRTNWFLYVLSATLEIVVLAGYWTLDYGGERLAYTTVFQHGIVSLLVLFDGSVVGKVPMRIKQAVWIFGYGVLYIAWSCWYALWMVEEDGAGTGDGGQGHGTKHGYKRGRGALYPFLDWRNDPRGAAMVAATLLFVVAPIAFAFCWAVSLAAFGGRRYL